MEPDKKLIISVKEARKLMGRKESAIYSDAEMVSIIEQLHFLAEISGKEAHKQLFKELVPKST